MLEVRSVATDVFSILRLPPGRYSGSTIDRQYQSVRRQILRAGGPDRQRRLDDALIAHALLRDTRGQTAIRQRAEAELICRPRRPAAERRTIRKARPVPVPRRPIARPREMTDPGAARDIYTRFAGCVTERIEAGLLRFTERQRLMTVAEEMGVGTFKANLIIAEVLHDVRGNLPPGRLVTGPVTAPATPAGRSRHGLWLALAAAAAMCIDLAIILLTG